ncbi:phage holin family protein [Nocardioides sp. Y6]|uniref:Phage holin family protein n=1 Tax=Nocardioides malaquae TaxID=2773426 RepID=A0ABR9RWM1_9ACTN|nr:phage holin family protein [Nocardioides malaquae]MBE7325978.1 phage holin family protein [Nocardioides malaquae]
MRFLGTLIATMAGVAAAAWLFDGIWFEGTDGPLGEELRDKVLPVALVAVIVWVVDQVVAPVVKLLSLPLVVLTLGLFLLVVNAAMLMLAAWIAGQADLGFHVDGFWVALGGALVITLVERVVSALLVEDR